MTQVPDHIWHEIAKMASMRTGFCKALFIKDMAEATDEVYKQLVKEFEHETVSAFIDFGILYIENKAITDWVNIKGAHDIRQALPEICSLDEVFAWYEQDKMKILTIQQRHEIELMISRTFLNVRYIID